MTALIIVYRHGVLVLILPPIRRARRLSFLDSEAGDWATPYREEFGGGVMPFRGAWSTCVDEFKKRFSVVTVEDAARTELKKTRQGKGTVVQYESRFNQYADKSKYNKIALRELFYEGLSEDMKKRLLNTVEDVTSLDDLKKVALKLDKNQIEYDRSRQGLREARAKRHDTLPPGEPMDIMLHPTLFSLTSMAPPFPC